MKFKQVLFLPGNIAERLDPPGNNWALISISCPGDRADIIHTWPSIKRVEFHDIQAFRSGYTCFSYEQADGLISYLECIVAARFIDTLVVHCAAGISRSAAVAMFAQENYSERKYKLLGTEKHNKLVKDMLDYQLKERANHAKT